MTSYVLMIHCLRFMKQTFCTRHVIAKFNTRFLFFSSHFSEIKLSLAKLRAHRVFVVTTERVFEYGEGTDTRSLVAQGNAQGKKCPSIRYSSMP